jgi:hypothetical protein
MNENKYTVLENGIQKERKSNIFSHWNVKSKKEIVKL